MLGPTPQPDWIPIGEQFLDVGASTALTIPALPAGQTKQGTSYVAILQAQGQAQYIRRDGTAAVASLTGGLLLVPGDWIVQPGYQILTKIRVIRALAGGALVVTYYTCRPGAALAVGV